MSNSAFDLVVRGGLVFDGRGSRAAVRNVGVTGGRVAAVSDGPLEPGPGGRVIDAAGCWVTPGFIDLHTHYDAEVEVAPQLTESLRHGVTTVLLGSCSLSLAMGEPEDLADTFCRVEAVPRNVVLPILRERKTWNTLEGYFDHLDALPLGPNVGSFVGHSALRMFVLGFERSLSRKVRPSEDELRRMERLVSEGLDAGYVGLSVQTLKWDKMDGTRERSKPLPSTYATWGEYRRLTRVLRARERVFQGVPNVSTKVNVLLFLLESAGLWRKPLKTTIIALMDPRADRVIHRVAGAMARVTNTLLGGNFRFQALPELFDLWADGIDAVVFEEFGAGTAALHLQDAVERAQLLVDPKYRAWFRQQWTNRFLPRAFHRDFNQSKVLEAPEPGLVGKSFVQIGRERGGDAVDAFLDLVARHGPKVRWYTVMANDRPERLRWIVDHPDVLIGFSDAGAHLRQMAHYNFPLRLLHLVREAERAGRPVMSVERAVWRLTGEIADWLGLDAGKLEVGSRADLCVVDPERLDAQVDAIAEEAVPEFGGLVRLVRRNDAAVRAVVVRGRVAWTGGADGGGAAPELGRERVFGSVLRVTG